jgi:hypothetical protein
MKSLAFLCILSLLSGILSVQAADNATVTATVTVQNIAVSITANGTITYGTLGQNATKSTNSADLNTPITVRNDGNIAEDFDINGQNSASWTLAGSVGSDQYKHMFCKTTDGSCASPPTSYTALTTTPAALYTSVAALGTKIFDLYINTPNPSTVFTSQSVDVLITASAS